VIQRVFSNCHLFHFSDKNEIYKKCSGDEFE
jgi:hypothetical protein